MKLKFIFSKKERRMLRKLIRQLIELLLGLFLDKTPPPVPGRASLKKKEQLDMARFGFTFDLPAPVNPADVAKRRTLVTVGGVAQDPVELPGSALESSQIVLNEDETGSLQLADADAKGNWSNYGEAVTFTANDDVAPATPGAVTLKAKVQLPDA